MMTTPFSSPSPRHIPRLPAFGKSRSASGAMILRFLLLVGLVVLSRASARAASQGPAAGNSAPAGSQADPSWAAFQKTVAPFFARYCYVCHGPDRMEKGVRLDLFTDEQSLHTQIDVLNRTLAMLLVGKMPPPCEYSPTPPELNEVVAWIVAWDKIALGAQK